MSGKYQLRFLCYLKALGMTEAQYEAKDGPLTGRTFAGWIHHRLHEFRRDHPEAFFVGTGGHITHCIRDYAAWDAYLRKCADEGRSSCAW